MVGLVTLKINIKYVRDSITHEGGNLQLRLLTFPMVVNDIIAFLQHSNWCKDVFCETIG